jgi:hypothetical protein
MHHFKRIALTRVTPLCTRVHTKVPTRNLNIHEYQGQKLLKQFGVNCPNGSVAETPAEVEKIAEVLSMFYVVLILVILDQHHHIPTTPSHLLTFPPHTIPLNIYFGTTNYDFSFSIEW